MAGVDPAIHVLAADKDVDARAKPAHDAAEALRELARMKGWGGDALQIPLRFPVNIIRVTPASMPANFICLQFAESRVRTNKEQKEGTHRQPIHLPRPRSSLPVFAYLEFRIRSRTIISRHFAQTKPTGAQTKPTGKKLATSSNFNH
jgi:hypothetical protein